MHLLIRSYFCYITKITVFFKHLLITYVLFSSAAYPLSNNNYLNSHQIRVSEKVSDSLIMQKALEAEILVKSQEYKKAAEIYFDISLKTEDPEIAKRATQLAGYAKDYKLMLKSSDRWLKIAEDKIPVRHIRISIFLAQNKVELATKETLSAIKFSKDKDKFALVYDTLKVFDDEIIALIFEKIYAEYKNEYLASFYYVQVLLNNNAYEKAINLINQASKFEEFNKRESRWGIFLAKAYFELGKDDLSVKILKEYLSYSPKDVYLNQYYVNILTQQENYKEAIKHYRFMSANKLINFGDIGVAKKMALLNIKASNYIDADLFIDSLKDKNINSYYYLKGILNANKSYKNNDKKSKAEAENFFNKVDISSDEYINSVKEFSNIKIRDKEYLLLKNYFKEQRSKVKNKEELEIRLILVETEIFFNEKKYNYAMDTINYGLEKYKDNGSFLYTRALVAEKIDRLDILESDLKKLIKMEPNNAQAMNALGYTWANNNINLSKAHEYIDKALAILPNDAAILDSKGWVLYKLGKYKSAESYFVKALKISQDTEIVSHFIKLLIKLKKLDRAKQIYARYIKISPQDENLIKLKKILNEI